MNTSPRDLAEQQEAEAARQDYQIRQAVREILREELPKTLAEMGVKVTPPIVNCGENFSSGVRRWMERNNALNKE